MLSTLRPAVEEESLIAKFEDVVAGVGDEQDGAALLAECSDAAEAFGLEGFIAAKTLSRAA